jgi:hypothetical protein
MGFASGKIDERFKKRKPGTLNNFSHSHKDSYPDHENRRAL